jgi:AraC-like DNA-binding protein
VEWPIRNLDLIVRWISLLLDQIRRPLEFGSADRIDRLCEMLIMEMAADQARPVVRDNDLDIAALEAIRTYLEVHCLERMNLAELAKSRGLSPSTFRRKWSANYAIPPAHYLIQRRMEEACRLLKETGLRIKEIAEKLHFDDPLYFSRSFGRFIGCSPENYLSRHGYSRKK